MIRVLCVKHSMLFHLIFAITFGGGYHRYYYYYLTLQKRTLQLGEAKLLKVRDKNLS